MTENNASKKKILVNRKKLGDAVRNELYDNLTEIHKETGIPRSRLLDQALEMLSDKYKKSYTK